MKPTMTRRCFLKYSAAGAAGAVFPLADTTEKVFLKSSEQAEFPSLPKKLNPMMKLTAANGAFGISKSVGGCRDLKAAEAAIAGASLLDHENLYNLMIAKGVPKSQLTVVDIACWDLHARMLKKPLHALLGTKKTKILRYGDVRGQQTDFSPEKYAAAVARYFEYSKLQATKLHFPGAMGTPESIPFKDILETLRQVRKAVGDEKILAWDPYPGSAESATDSVDEAKEILKLMDELHYAWIEGPLPPMP